MRPSISRLLFGLFAAPLMLASSTAMAGAEACGNFEAAATGQCDFEVSGGCKADCQPLNFVVACDGQCTADASIDCTGGCEASCEAECNVDPGSFQCAASCKSSCEASCDSSCSDSGCLTQCQASCGHRCDLDCKVQPPTADCKGYCKVSCDASCKVQANVDCNVSCTSMLQGGCEVDCDTPRGALFCTGPDGRPQYVDVAASVEDCIAYLESKGFGVQVTGACDVNGCTGSGTVSCSAAPAVGAIDDKLGVGAIAGLMMGLGMIVTRRRRRA